MNKTAVALGLTTSLAVFSMATTASALSLPGHMGPGMRGHGIVGEVSAISGSTLSVNSHGFGPNAATTTYSVDASNATIYKDNATSSLSAIAAGDTVMVQGTVNGTSVAAQVIRDGVPALGKWQGKPGGPRPNFPEVQGNGQPVIGGSISAISGSTITVGTKAGTSFTVDASNATVVKGNATSSVANLAVGDNVVVQGSVNGSNVTASSIIAGAQHSVNVTDDDHGPFGFFGGIGGFLHRLFGFF